MLVLLVSEFVQTTARKQPSHFLSVTLVFLFPGFLQVTDSCKYGALSSWTEVFDFIPLQTDFLLSLEVINRLQNTKTGFPLGNGKQDVPSNRVTLSADSQPLTHNSEDLLSEV